MFQRPDTGRRTNQERPNQQVRRRLRSHTPGRLRAFALLLAMSIAIATGAAPTMLARASETRPAGSHAPIQSQNQPRALPPTLHIPHYDPGPLSVSDGETLTYEGSWLGIPAALATIKIHRGTRHPNAWRAGLTVTTSGVVALIFRMQDQLSEEFDADPLSPRSLLMLNNENRRHYSYKIDFDPSKHLVTAVKTGPRSVKKRSFIADNPWGPITGSVMALSQPLHVGKSFVYDVFTGTDRYVVQLSVERHERIHTPLGTVDALRVAPSIPYTSNNKLRDKVRSVVVWVSADRPRLPLRIESRIFVGWIRVDLIKVNSALAGNRGRQVARTEAAR